jgi:hypothetical protein
MNAKGMQPETAPEAAAEPARSFGPDEALVLAAVVIGVVLRLWLAVRSEVWLDEANSVLISLGPVGDLAATLGQDSSPPLYYLVLKAWAAIGPFDPLWLRAPSIVFGSAAIPALWLVGRAMDRPRTGALAAWLLAVHPLHAYYSEEIRMYAMLVLLGLAFYYAVFHVMRRSGALLPASLAGIAVAYTHYYGLVFVGAALLVALIAIPDRRTRTLLCGSAIALAFLPWLPVFLAQLENPHHVSWIATYWEQYPKGFGVVRTAQAFTPGGLKYTLVPMQGIGFQPLVAVVALLPFAWLALRPAGRKGFAPLALPAAVIGVTLLLLVVRSYTGDPIYLAGRSDIVLLPLFILIFAMAASRMNPAFQATFLIAWTALAGAELERSAEILRKPGNERMAQAVSSAECRTVVATGLSYAPVLFYQMLEGDGARVVPYPIDVGEHPGNFDVTGYSPRDLQVDANLLVREFPPEPGLCDLAWEAGFPGPLAEAYLVTGARARSMGVFSPSLVTTGYVLMSF